MRTAYSLRAISVAEHSRVHDDLQLAVEFSPMPPLQVIILRLAVFFSGRDEARLHAVIPSGIFQGAIAVVAIMLVTGFESIVSQIQKRLQGRLALVRQVVRDAPVEPFREDVVRSQSVYCHAESYLQTSPTPRHIRVPSIAPFLFFPLHFHASATTVTLRERERVCLSDLAEILEITRRDAQSSVAEIINEIIN